MKTYLLFGREFLKNWNWVGVVVALLVLVAAWIFNSANKEKAIDTTVIQSEQTLPAAQSMQPHNPARYRQESFSAAVKTVLPSVVSICVFELKEGNLPAGASPQAYQEIGSGIIVSPEGDVLTNYHVVVDADDIKVTRFDGDHRHVYDAQVAGFYPDVDLAIVKISGKEVFPAAHLGNSDQMIVGNWVLAAGTPFGLDQSVTAGIISATRQTVMINGVEYHNLIQTDASIHPGNSGGPLINVRGEVIGINTAIPASPQLSEDIGFCIPSNVAKDVLNQAGIQFLGK